MVFYLIKVLGFGHSFGINSLVIPGSGEANFDSLELNPYQTKKQRQETEVHSLLEKIQPEMITLNPGFIGKFNAGAENEKFSIKETGTEIKPKPKNKQRGRSSSVRRLLKKQANIVSERKVFK